MGHLEKELLATGRRWGERGLERPRVMVVAGSGLGSTDLGQRLRGPMDWSELLPFSSWGIEGHPLELELLQPLPGRVALFSRGRLHAYQGFTAAQVVFPVRLAALLGARVLVLTNSAGGLHAHQRSGDLVVISDHLNLTGRNPLYGSFPASWGVQFPDLVSAYDPALRELIREVAGELGIAVSEGVYAGVSGPSYETAAEVRMLRSLGGDVVGMSTVLEVIAGHHMGLRCAALSLVSNPGAGVTGEPLDHADVLQRGRQAAGKIGRLLSALLAHPRLEA